MRYQKQYLAEFLGTMMLTFFGCGTAMLVGCVYLMGCGYILTALAFGFVMALCVYLFGNISGCHINPAVTFAMYLDGRIKRNKAICYAVCQCCGALIGVEILAVIFGFGSLPDQTGCFAANGLGGVGNNYWIGLIVEFILSMVFVGTVLKITDKNSSVGNLSGILIGGCLALVHIVGIGLTGTSVNPARSLAPAIEAWIFNGNLVPVKQLIVFIIGPLAGAWCAARLYQYFKREEPRKNVRKEVIKESEKRKSEDDKSENGQNFEGDDKELDDDNFKNIEPLIEKEDKIFEQNKEK